MVGPLLFETSTTTGFRNKEYNQVEDLYDTRIPLHNEDVFEHGLRYKAKVGWWQCVCVLTPQTVHVDTVEGILW